MRLFGIPKREDGERLGPNATEERAESVRSARSGESPSQSSNGGDSQSFGQMKLVIKNTFIGGYEENAEDDDPPRTLARSASDSKLDCQSSTSSVLFWYPQRGGTSMSRSNSSVMSRSDADDLDDSEVVEQGPGGAHHMVYGRSRAAQGNGRSAATTGQDGYAAPRFAGQMPVDSLPRMPNIPSPAGMGDVPHDVMAPIGLGGVTRPPGNFFAQGPILRPPGIFDGSTKVPPAASFRSDESEGNGLLDLQLLKMQAELAEITAQQQAAAPLPKQPPQEQLSQMQQMAQLQQLQQLQQQMQQLHMPAASDAALQQMPTPSFPPAAEVPAQVASPADRKIPSPLPSSSAAAGQPEIVQHQLQQQLLESQMQQLQLQQQMQQLQLQTQRLQQQLAVQGPEQTQPSEEDALLAQIPFNDEGERASIGSRLHPDNCNPCIFWFKDKTFCNKGIMCDFCHFRHQGQKNKRIRPSKNTRLQMRAAQAARAATEVPGLA